jgi:hypothetical protein
MAVIAYLEKNYPSVDIKAIYKWIQKKLNIAQDYRFTKSKKRK